MSKIEWTDRTLNPLVGCTKISSGCANCYAEVASASGRLQQFPQYKTVVDGRGFWNGTVNFVPEQLEKIFKIKKPTRIFMPSMSDIFHPAVKDEWRDQIFASIAVCPHITAQILTKRPEAMRDYFLHREDHIRVAAINFIFDRTITPKQFAPWTWNYPIPNLWLGVTVEDQLTANAWIPMLLGTPAAKRFLSCEPLLEQVNLIDHQLDDRRLNYLVNSWSCSTAPTIDSGNMIVSNYKGIDWVIVGGESGSGARRCDGEWISSVVEQCRSNNVPVFVKQMGSNFYVNGVRQKFKSRSGGDIEGWEEQFKIREL